MQIFNKSNRCRVKYNITLVHHNNMVSVTYTEEESFQQQQERIAMKNEKKEMKKVVLIRPPLLSSGLVSLPIPPNTPAVELYGEEEEMPEGVFVPLFVPVPALLFKKSEPSVIK